MFYVFWQNSMIIMSFNISICWKSYSSGGIFTRMINGNKITYVLFGLFRTVALSILMRSNLSSVVKLI